MIQNNMPKHVQKKTMIKQMWLNAKNWGFYMKVKVLYTILANFYFQLILSYPKTSIGHIVQKMKYADYPVE